MLINSVLCLLDFRSKRIYGMADKVQLYLLLSFSLVKSRFFVLVLSKSLQLNMNVGSMAVVVAP